MLVSLRAIAVGVIVVLRSASTAIASPARNDNIAYSAIVVFGDSFSDDGNGAWVVSNHTWPANPNYFGGRFSNGPVWIEYVASNLSVPLLDFATGGATTSNALVQGYTGPHSVIPVRSIDEQVVKFLQEGAPSNVSLEAPLFVLMGGANDPLFNLSITASQSFHALISSTAQLASRYPSAHFLFLNYPDLARIPMDFYVDENTKQALHKYSTELDALYRESIPKNLESVRYVDVLPLFAEWDYYGAPEKFGFTPLGTYGSCLTGVYSETPGITLCEDADEVVFWDEYHPTTHAHSWIAKLVLAELDH
ncbi:GDSL lipase/esterase [Dichomitus squalens]|uniref:GDSL lipase/esterase n=2 Tax=Dichomitus squalens TaxID=114155 RepID=A0A4Q9Q0Q0_9APHY|nr:uncharacterized protein DICSQDRAFT_138442 [Dichomitus squalens LYAD-421 SS1]EJF59503.1 hypothetical protein DICSQDRAFT_138442 [Dichomitus squalens LYAD-421 SS1]TBU22386.1 GDSL lipase/esterase [Dichomitus squalens]TBU39275.1 GDSL lipase/esterase [Dichomitus squalens]TBU60386.1 GDSL lipase/esterase [Dichomitus squalens]